ncbi:hypothetical protein CIRG_02151 [Coccidioides immitis RMSCC 2394]|nr:hypothetical protein CIRG_02151 [Coccidioides immitis RMSCC 2394]
MSEDFLLSPLLVLPHVLSNPISIISFVSTAYQQLFYPPIERHDIWKAQSALGCRTTFCSEHPELQMTPDQYIENLTPAHVKTFLDWFRETHQESVKAASSLDCYWRVLKSLYVDKHGFGMDEAMQRDCRNYKNCIIRLMGLRRRPKRKPSGNKDDIYRILIGHWTRCTRVYADEKQCLYVATGILLSYVSGSRLVSLFDTRVEANDENVREGWSNGSSSRPADTGNLGIALKKNTNTLAVTGHHRRTRPRGAHAKAAPEVRRRNQPSMLKRSKRPPIKDDREPYDVKRPRIDTLHRTRRSTQDGIACEDITYDAEDSDPGAYSDSDDADSDVGYASEDDSSSSDTGTFAVNEPDSGTDVDTDTEAIASFVDSGYNTDDINDLDCYMDELDCSTGQVDIGELNRLVKEDRSKLNRFIEDVTDDEYDAGEEETATLLWRHIEFHIIRSPEEGRPNILLAKVTLLHTKGEDNKPRVKTFVISHSPEPILDLLSHILSLAIDDEIFVADFPRFEDIYRYPIPSHLKGMQLKIRRDKLDLPVFREPEKTANGYRTSEKKPMKASTWARYLIHVGLVAALKYYLTQYVFRRSLINAINRTLLTFSLALLS